MFSFEEALWLAVSFLLAGLADDSKYMKVHMHTQIEVASRISCEDKFMVG